MNAPVRIALVAGEASGDLLGSRLIEALRRRLPEAEFCGIGGPRMIAGGFESWFPQEKLAVRGFVEVVRHLRDLLAIRAEVLRRMRAQRATLFIGIDSPEFNLGLERKLKRAGLTTVHLVNPQVWAWRRGRIRRMKDYVSHLLVLFPFEEISPGCKRWTRRFVRPSRRATPERLLARRCGRRSRFLVRDVTVGSPPVEAEARRTQGTPPLQG